MWTIESAGQNPRMYGYDPIPEDLWQDCTAQVGEPTFEALLAAALRWKEEGQAVRLTWTA